jgi:hypothetical protein
MAIERNGSADYRVSSILIGLQTVLAAPHHHGKRALGMAHIR